MRARVAASLTIGAASLALLCVAQVPVAPTFIPRSNSTTPAAPVVLSRIGPWLFEPSSDGGLNQTVFFTAPAGGLTGATANFGAVGGAALNTACTGCGDTFASAPVPTALAPSSSQIQLSVTRSGVQSNGLAAFAPDTVQDCPYLWVVSPETTVDAGSSKVIGWVDNSRTYYLWQQTAGAQPTYSLSAFDAGTVAEVASIHCNAASSQSMANSTTDGGPQVPTLPTGLGLVIIANTPSLTGGNAVWVGDNGTKVAFFSTGGGIAFYSGTAVANTGNVGAHLYNVTFGTSGRILQDAVQVNTGNVGANAFTGGPIVCAWTGGIDYQTADIAAFALCNSATDAGAWRGPAHAVGTP
jgi:hypothetical protein